MLISILAFYIVYPVLAHGDEPRLEISAERINPGETVDVRGVDFEFEELVILTLISSGYELSLGEVTADTEGIFLLTIILPPDLAEDIYYFRAVTDDHEILSPALTVAGPAIIEGEGGEGQRDEDDPLQALDPILQSVPTEEGRERLIARYAEWLHTRWPAGTGGSSARIGQCRPRDRHVREVLDGPLDVKVASRADVHPGIEPGMKAHIRLFHLDLGLQVGGLDGFDRPNHDRERDHHPCQHRFHDRTLPRPWAVTG